MTKKTLNTLSIFAITTIQSLAITPKPAPFFYEITGNNIDPAYPSYLLGSCHSLAAQDYSDHIRSKIENTQILISEFPDYAILSTTGKNHLSRIQLIYNKFLSQDLYWFRDQFLALGLSPDEIKSKLNLIKNSKEQLEHPNFSQTWLPQLSQQEQNLLATISLGSNIDLLSIHPAILWEFIDYISEAIPEQQFTEDSFEVHLIRQFIVDRKSVV